MITTAERDEIMKALAPAARAFERAKRKGYAWLNPQTEMFETSEPPLCLPETDQLRLPGC